MYFRLSCKIFSFVSHSGDIKPLISFHPVHMSVTYVNAICMCFKGKHKSSCAAVFLKMLLMMWTIFQLQLTIQMPLATTIFPATALTRLTNHITCLRKNVYSALFSRHNFNMHNTTRMTIWMPCHERDTSRE